MSTGATVPARGGETVVRYVEETGGYNCDPNGGSAQAWPDPPAGNANTKLTTLRVNDCSLEIDKPTEVSPELTSGAVDGDIIDRGAASRGGLGFRFRPDEYDPFIAAAIRSANFDTGSPAVDNQSITATMTAATRTVTGTGIATGLPSGAAAAGWWVRFRGFSEAGNNIIALVSSAPDADTIVLATGVSGLVDETSGAGAVDVYAEMIENGSSGRSFMFERHFSDKADSARPYTYFPGCYQDFSIDAGEEVVEGSLSVLGAKPITTSSGSGTTVGDGSPTAAGTTSDFRSENNIGICAIDNVDIGTVEKLNSFSIATNNNIEVKRRVKQGAVALQRSLGLGGTLNSDFITNEFQRRNYKHLTGSLAFAFNSAADVVSGVAYLFYFPKVYILAGDPNPSGKDSDVTGAYTWAAAKDATTGKICRVFKYVETP